MILVSATMATSLYAMTIMIVSVILPQIQGSLSATQDQIALAVTFNLVATAVATPMTGWLVARFGRRNLFMYCLTGFALATAACGSADSLGSLVFYRIVQGAFGAPLVPLSQATILDTYPKEQHGFASSVFGMGVVIAPVFGPIVGGYLSEAYNWRWAFYMVVPLAVVALLGVYTFITDRGREHNARFDWIGFLALSGAVVCFQLMLDRGERQDWFDSPEILIEAVVALVAFHIFIVHSLTSERPFMNLRLLLDRNYALGLFIVALYGMLNFTPMVLMPPLLQGVLGYPDAIIGFLLGMRGIGALCGFFAAIFLNRLDPRVGIIGGYLIQAYSGWQMANFDLNITAVDVAVQSILQGFAVGVIWVPLTVATFSTLDKRYLSEASATYHLLRNFGSSLFISVSVTLVIRTTKINYAGLTEYISPFNKLVTYPSITGLWNTETVTGLAAVSGEIGRQAAMVGYLNAFHFYMFACLAVIPVCLLVRMPKQPAG